MSAIWGAIDFSGNDISEKMIQQFRDAYKDCKIDRIEEAFDKGVYFGCGIQYITPESHGEKLPYDEDGRFFTADVILDNRGEICEKLGLDDVPSLPDGEILKTAFERLGKESFNLMLGAYVFVSYDKKTKRVDIVSDAIGNRYVFYTIKDNCFYFSSLMKPLEAVREKNCLDAEWISDFVGMDGMNIFINSEDTQLKDIRRIAPATNLVVENGKVTSKFLYWDVKKIKRTRNIKTDAEYKEEFRNLYKKCVGDVLRSDNETSILLSSGYDSTSVACLAAPILKERGKKLYSFTSVPLKGYVSDGPEYEIADETELVKKTAKYLGNVECSSIGLEDINLFDYRKVYSEICEMPYKSVENMVWLYQGHVKASENGSRIILVGSFGNGTVSMENAYQYLLWLFRRFRFVKFWKEMNALHKRMGYGRKHTIKLMLKGFFRINLLKNGRTECYKKSYGIEDFFKKNGTIKRINKSDREMKFSYDSAEKYHRLFLPLLNFRHYGEFAQKHSIRTGVVLRDPTRDRRMVEFVLSAPFDQFTHNGYTRRLIREYMEDIMPPGYFYRHPFGVQSADIKYRFETYGDAVINEMKSIAEKYDGKGVIDTDKIINDLRKEKQKDFSSFDYIRLFYTINLLEYMDKYEM